MEVTGKIIQKLPLQEGTSKAGNAWKKQIYVLETINESFPRKVAFDFFGDRVTEFDAICEVGNVITLSFDIESREYNGRWYTDIRGWKAAPYVAQQPVAQPTDSAAPAATIAPAAGPQVVPPPADMDFASGVGETDDIPF